MIGVICHLPSAIRHPPSKDDPSFIRPHFPFSSLLHALGLFESVRVLVAFESSNSLSLSCADKDLGLHRLRLRIYLNLTFGHPPAVIVAIRSVLHSPNSPHRMHLLALALALALLFFGVAVAH